MLKNSRGLSRLAGASPRPRVSMIAPKMPQTDGQTARRTDKAVGAAAEYSSCRVTPVDLRADTRHADERFSADSSAAIDIISDRDPFFERAF